MSKRKINIPETKGTFQLSGLIQGVQSKNFYDEKVAKNGKNFRRVHFGLKTNENSTNYVDLNGMEQDNVYFYKKSEEKGKKGKTKPISWNYRNKFNEEGFKIIGVNLGLSKTLNEKGKEVNDKKTMVEYDACKFIKDKLKDDKSVFTKGKLEYGSYDKNGVTQRTVKFIPSQISLCKPIDFADEKFKEVADFKQRIVFMEIEKDDSNKNDIRFIVSAKIVNYSSIEKAEFIIRNNKLAQVFRKNLKPYTSIDIWGKIANTVQVEEVTEEDIWGEESEMDKGFNPTKKELIITGADPKTIDKETYSEDKMEEAVRALKEFGESIENNISGWGDDSKLDNNEDDGEWA